jgi:hypothetical protein
MREEVRTWRKLGIGSAIAFFGLTLSLLAFGANLYRQNSDLNRQLMEDKHDLHDASEKISKLQSDIDRLSRPDKQPQPTPEIAHPGDDKKNPH